MRLGQQRKPSDPFQWQHLLAWLGGILCAMVPFIGAWEIGAMQVPVRFGSGNFGFNLLIATGLCTLGSLIGGYWWRIGKWLLDKNDGVMTAAVVVLFLLGIVGVVTPALDQLFLYLVCGVLILGLILAFVFRGVRPHQWPSFYDFIQWLGVKKPWNAAYFLILLVVLMVNNFSLVWGMDARIGEKASIVAGRLFTHAALVGVCFLLAEMTMRSAPKYFRWVPWLALGLIPLLVITDQLLGIMWNRPLINVVNGLTQSGQLDLAVELKTSGLDVGPLGAWLIVLGVFAVAMLMAGGCWLISKHYKMSISVGWALLVTFVCWLVVIAEQGVGSNWKQVTVWQDERKAFDLHLGLFAPPQGVGSYRVTFYEGVADHQGAVPSLINKPDVFIFMLESTRADAIRPDVAPFLSQFRDTECQPFDGTWAASNATHLSWFAFFHSRVPIFWREALEGIPDRKKYHGAIPLQQLKQAGYAIEVRAVCDLGYKDFGFSNFGYEKNLVDVLEQAHDGSELEKLNVSEREKITFERLRESVLNRPDTGAGGGGLYITALDSPHYNYYWHKDFDPPFKEYDENTRFPLNPTKNEVQRVVNRYWNSIAWVDFQVKEFCDFLKAEGRYDNSIIIVTGDHGEEFQEQGSWFHCSSLRPEQTAVPLMIKWTSLMGRGPSRDDVNHIDVIPTLMNALGMPANTIDGLAGRNLLAEEGHFTAISTTAFAGKSGETMVLRRAGYEAVFLWERYWESEVPGNIVLELIRDPEGNKIKLKDADAYADELRRLFPDAFDRFFKTLEVIED
ncbi:MAG: sulfatase-like hydrolase/transferase [Verrucomicrobiae bacterium]|nr:sulfatase-like hydrolase/transferase [Verrucomicrobiae bacterium]NNJ86499.1 sulfatase-like hydrolase/transferase [Akkermansiaceae bacterium]